MSYITHIGTANPENKFHQQELAEFMVKAHELSGDDASKLRALYRATGIETRHSVIADFHEANHEFFPNSQDLEPFPTTEQRMKLYRSQAVELSLAAIRAAGDIDSSSITHLISVSCTGMYAPGLDVDLIKRLHLSTRVHRTCVNFMGCYAAFSALKLADAFCKADASARVLVVCTELCSIHFQKEKTEDNLLANALFADGSAALVVENSPISDKNFRIRSFYCDLLLNGEEEMAWSLGNFGFEMKLSSYVPAVLESGLSPFKDALLRHQSVDYFVIHPGGKRILEVIEEELGVTRSQNGHAFEVLRKYGNMSSPTILFVLKALQEKLKIEDNGKTILGMGFGPGLALESCLLESTIA